MNTELEVCMGRYQRNDDGPAYFIRIKKVMLVCERNQAALTAAIAEAAQGDQGWIYDLDEKFNHHCVAADGTYLTIAWFYEPHREDNDD